MLEDACAHFSYTLDLQPEAWTGLRLHTYHFTGDNYQSYMDSRPGQVCAQWAMEVADLPEGLRITEPQGGIGFLHQGRLISADVARFQHVSWYAPPTRCPQGTGRPTASDHPRDRKWCGGLGYHLHRIIGMGTRVLVDLPETLLSAANYLALNCPDANVYLYEPSIEPSLAYDFVLLPNFKLELLQSWRFDLALNMESFQEMKPEHVDEYLGFIAKDESRLYSLNQDGNPVNPELNDLSSRLGRYFQMNHIARNTQSGGGLRIGFIPLTSSVWVSRLQPWAAQQCIETARVRALSSRSTREFWGATE